MRKQGYYYNCKKKKNIWKSVGIAFFFLIFEALIFSLKGQGGSPKNIEEKIKIPVAGEARA